MNPAWSWVLTAWGVAGLLIAGRGTWQGWVINLSAQGAWAAYAIVTAQWGFLVSATLYAAVYAHNARAGRRRARARDSAHARANQEV